MYPYQHLEDDLLNMDPVELVCLLYSKALEKLHQARIHLDADNIQERSKAIARAMEIILELQGSLNFELGGEVAENLARLYEYMQQRLGEANAQQKKAPLEEVITLLSVLYEGWKSCKEQVCLENLRSGVRERFGAGQGRAWTL